MATLRSDEDMGQLSIHRKRLHRHSGVRTFVLLQRLGIPYEVERTVCSECRRVLDERPLKRAPAYRSLRSVWAPRAGTSPALPSIFSAARASYPVGLLFTIASCPPADSVSSGRPATG